MDWELVTGDVKGRNWNEIIRSSCPVSSLNEALLRVIMDRAISEQLWSERVMGLSLMTGVSWLTAYRVWSVLAHCI